MPEEERAVEIGAGLFSHAVGPLLVHLYFKCLEESKELVPLLVDAFGVEGVEGRVGVAGKLSAGYVHTLPELCRNLGRREEKTICRMRAVDVLYKGGRERMR